jgi:ribosomal protein L7/L12
MNAYYQQAIDILTSDNDWRAICVAMAKIHPKEFCEAFGKQPWQIEALRINTAEGKVAAIKYMRGETGMGIAEAKETIEGLVA